MLCKKKINGGSDHVCTVDRLILHCTCTHSKSVYTAQPQDIREHSWCPFIERSALCVRCFISETVFHYVVCRRVHFFCIILRSKRQKEQTQLKQIMKCFKKLSLYSVNKCWMILIFPFNLLLAAKFQVMVCFVHFACLWLLPTLIMTDSQAYRLAL